MRQKHYWDVVNPCNYCGEDYIINGGRYRSKVKKGQERFYCKPECGYADRRNIFGIPWAQVHSIRSAVRPIGMTRRGMLNSNGRMCWNCLRQPSRHLHHVKPVRLGGSNHWTNLFPLCEPCHYRAFEAGFEREHRAKWGKGWTEYTVEYNMYIHHPLIDWFSQEDRLNVYHKHCHERRDSDAVARIEKYNKEREEWENHLRAYS